MKLAGITIDALYPDRQAEFYARLLGSAPTELPGGRWMVHTGSEVALYFVRPDGGFEQALEWPRTGDKRFHLEIATNGDLLADAARAEALGAAILDSEVGKLPHGQAWIVLADPEGHPFCIVDYDVLMGG